MGLDMFAFAANSVEDLKSESNRKEIAIWRKHNRLQGWMENLYKSKGGKDEFNCTPLELTESDLKALEKDIKKHNLPATQGFFFGHDSYEGSGTYPDYDADIKFLKDARKFLKEGKKIYYYCWW